MKTRETVKRTDRTERNYRTIWENPKYIFRRILKRIADVGGRRTRNGYGNACRIRVQKRPRIGIVEQTFSFSSVATSTSFQWNPDIGANSD